MWPPSPRRTFPSRRRQEKTVYMWTDTRAVAAVAGSIRTAAAVPGAGKAPRRLRLLGIRTKAELPRARPSEVRVA